MIKCPKCGHENQEGLLDCDNCGEELSKVKQTITLEPITPKVDEEAMNDEDIPSLEDDETAPSPRVSKCPACGTNNPVGQTHCNHCGASLQKISQEPQEPDVEPIPVAEEEQKPTPTPPQKPSGGIPKLVVIRGKQIGQEFPLHFEGDYIVGRPESTTGFKFVDIDLSDQEEEGDWTVHREHAIIRRKGDVVIVEDIRGENGNGTYINLKRIPCGVEQELKPGDTINFARVRLRFDS
jgi:hypothetical protein